MIKDEKLDFWIKNSYNVLFIGKHGVGKTTQIIQAFERNKLKWKYFSASTMDPFCDFVGIPYQKTTDGVTHLDFIRPKDLEEDTVEALFFDEFNRSAKKIRNAVMELIQFKSINGKKFKNLKFIWAAINPDDSDDSYDVEKLDPAQADRFHVQITVPYEPSLEYFTKVYGAETSKSAISWWKDLPAPEKSKVSPRRLDYALELYKNGGDLRDVLPATTNIGKLLSTLKTGPMSERVDKLFANKNNEETKKFLENNNNYTEAYKFITSTKDYMKYFIPLLSSEKISTIISDPASNKVSYNKVSNYIIDSIKDEPVFAAVAKEIVKSGTNKPLVKNLAKKLKELRTPEEKEADNKVLSAKFNTKIQSLKAEFISATNTVKRKRILKNLETELLSFKDYGANEAFDILSILELAAERSHSYTFMTTSNVNIIKNCIKKVLLPSETLVDCLNRYGLQNILGHFRKPSYSHYIKMV